jgi:Uma2 family endonuclease
MNLKYKTEPPLSEQDYLEGELISDIKHELIEGHTYAMAGASANHNRITMMLARKFGEHLENTPCEPFASDMKVKVKGDFFYPDVLVACQQEEAYYTESPILIIEILSKSTRQKDLSLKKLRYQSLASLQEYVVIEQDFVEIELFRRQNHWQSEHYFLGDKVYFSSIDLTISVETIYSRVVNEEMSDFYKKLNSMKINEGGIIV